MIQIYFDYKPETACPALLFTLFMAGWGKGFASGGGSAGPGSGSSGSQLQKAHCIPLPEQRNTLTHLISDPGAPFSFKHTIGIQVPEPGQYTDINLRETFAAGVRTTTEKFACRHGLSLAAVPGIPDQNNCIMCHFDLLAHLRSGPLPPNQVVMLTAMRVLPRPTYIQLLIDSYEAIHGEPAIRDINMFNSWSSIAANIGSVAPTDKQLHAFLINLDRYAFNLGIPDHSVTVLQTPAEADGKPLAGTTMKVHLVVNSVGAPKSVRVIDIPDKQRMTTCFHGNLYQHIRIEQVGKSPIDGKPTFKIGINLSPGFPWSTNKRRLDDKAALQPFAELVPVINELTREWRRFLVNSLNAPLGTECFTSGILNEDQTRATIHIPKVVSITTPSGSGPKSVTTELWVPSHLDITHAKADPPTDGRSADSDPHAPATSLSAITTRRVGIEIATRFVLALIQRAMSTGYPILNTGEFFLRAERRELYTGPVATEATSKPFETSGPESTMGPGSDFVPIVATPQEKPPSMFMDIEMCCGVHYLSAGTTRLGPNYDGFVPNMADLLISGIPKVVTSPMKHVPS
jgi:hypothetical protein